MITLERYGNYRVLSVTKESRYFRQGPQEPQVGDIIFIPGAEWALVRGGAFCWGVEVNDRYGTQFSADQLEPHP